MTRPLQGLIWLGLLTVVGVGMLGASSTPLPATGPVVLGALGWSALRHRQHMPRLLGGALLGHLPIACWPEAREVVCAARRGGEGAAWLVVLAGLGGIPFVPIPDQIGATVRALSPLLVAYGLSWLLWSPLERHLQRGFAAWQGGLREALLPPPAVLLDRSVPDRRPARVTLARRRAVSAMAGGVR